MVIFADGRIPLVFGLESEAGADDAVLHVAADAGADHAPGCACCAPRGAAARALTALFLARMRGERGYFERVVLVADDPDAVRAALAADPLVVARFRFAQATRN